MNSSISLKSFEQIARTRGLGSLVIGGLLIAFWLGGHGALYSAYRDHLHEKDAWETGAAVGKEFRRLGNPPPPPGP